MASGTINGSTSNQYIICKIEWSSTQNIAGNYSTVYASLYYKRTNTGYTTEGTGSFTINIGSYSGTTNNKHLAIGSDWVLAASHSVLIGHKDDGSQTITISATGSLPPSSLTSTSCSGSAVLDKIPRATVPEAPNAAQFGDSVRINLARASSSFTHTLTYKFGNRSGTIAAGVATYRNWTVPLTLANESIGPYGGYCQITCTTYNGNTVIGSKTTAVLLTAPDSMSPIINSVTVTATTDSQAAYDFFNGYIQGKSKLHITINASGQYSATIARYETTIDGVTYTGADVTTNVINGAATLPLSVTVTDTRKKVTTYNTSIDVLAYTPPAITEFSGERCLSDGTSDDEGTYLKAKIKYNIDPVNNKNTKTILFSCRQDGSDNLILLPITYVYTYDDYYISTEAILNTDNAYDVQISVLDYFDYASRNITIPTAFTVLDFDSSGKGLSIGEVAQGEGMTVALDLICKKNVNLLRAPQYGGAEIDLVIATGTDGNWYYRKWLSGYLELYYKSTMVSIDYGSTGSAQSAVQRLTVPDMLLTTYSYMLWATLTGWYSYATYWMDDGGNTISWLVRTTDGNAMKGNHNCRLHCEIKGAWK